MADIPGLYPTTPASSGVASRMDAYNGLVAKGATVLSVRNGGHTDYFGNEVIRFNALADEPAWELIRTWSTVAETGLSASVNYDFYPDGQPGSTHTYAHQRYIPQRDWVIQVGNTALAVNGGSTAKCIVYDVAANDYLSDGTVPDGPSITIADNGVWDDPATGNVYHTLGYQINRWNQASNTWTLNLKSVPNIYGTKTVGCTDTTRRRAIILGGDTAGQREQTVYGLDDNSSAAITLTGDTTITTIGQYGLVYCPTTDRFYAMTGAASNGAGLYEIHPTTWAVTVPTTTGATGMPAHAGVGVYTRFLYIAALGGCLYFPRHSANAWFLRLH